MRERDPRIVGVILALQDAPQYERSWARSAAGEEPCRAGARQALPRRGIDHIAIAGSGIRSSTPSAKRQAARRQTTVRQVTLNVGGRDKTKFGDDLAKQVDLVAAAVADTGLDVPVHGCFCFVDTELPLFGAPSINGLRIFGRRGLSRQLNATDSLTPTARRCSP